MLYCVLFQFLGERFVESLGNQEGLGPGVGNQVEECYGLGKPGARAAPFR